MWAVQADTPCVSSNWCTKILTEKKSVTSFSTTRPPPRRGFVVFVLSLDGLGDDVCIASGNAVLVMSNPSLWFSGKKSRDH